MRADPIVLVPYDSGWATAFERERARLEVAFGTTLVQPIEHIGSTAVPGLAAKPIIDMVAVVAAIEDVAARTDAIERTGWAAAPEPYDEAERRRSFCFPSVAHRTHHLHVVEDTCPAWRDWLAFRDHLRADPDAVAEYARLKADLAAAHGADPNDRTAYRSGKSDFVARAIRPHALVIAPDDPRRDDVRALIARHLSFSYEHTPIEDVYALDLEGLLDPAISFFSARLDEVIVGMGAIKQLDARHAELKSMHTAQEVRGQGVGRAMLDHLVAEARARGMRQVSLETGTMDAFAPARALYAAAGFVPSERFGDYPESASSAFMTLPLG